MAGSNFNAALSDGANGVLTTATTSTANDSGTLLLANCSGVPPTTAGLYEKGCIMQRLDTGVAYVNTGTLASPTWTALSNAVSATLTSAHLLVGNSSNVATDTAITGDVTISNTGVTTIGAGKVTGAKMVTGVGYFTVAKSTNGTTPVNVIAATVPFTCTITGVYLISQDTTAGNITVADTSGTVATIAKGATAGVMVGATSLANTSVTSGDTLTIVSSSAGNAEVFITFTTA